MFFQLSLPSTPPATDTGEDSVLQDPGTPGTLTVVAGERPAREQVARLLATPARDSKHTVRCNVGQAQPSACTFTAGPPRPRADEQFPNLQ